MDLYDKLDRAVTKAFQPTPLDKIITGIAKPIEADKLKEEMVVKVNDKIYIEQTSPPKIFSWEVFFVLGLSFFLTVIGVFLVFDSLIVRIISVIAYIAICIGGGMDI